jgi:hypothetical protein
MNLVALASAKAKNTKTNQASEDQKNDEDGSHQPLFNPTGVSAGG